MSSTRITDPDDPRLLPFRNLKDGGSEANDYCIAEGPLVVERLLQSPLALVSVLVDARSLARFEALAPDALVVERELLEEVAGFHFHRGILAAARRPTVPGPREALEELPPDAVLVVCPEINGPENLGSIYRVAAAFGAHAVVLGERCCDPLSRRCLRVSMGAALSVTTTISEDLADDLRWLRGRGVELLAAVVDDAATPLADCDVRRPCGLVLGTEADGLHAKFARECARRVTIPMAEGFADSLNVAVAAGVFLFQLTQGGWTSVSRRSP